MKFRKFTTAFFLTFLAATGLCNAQQKFIERTINYDKENFQSQGLTIASLSNNTWATAGWVGPCGHAFISAYNGNNSTIWTNKLMTIHDAVTVNELISNNSSTRMIAVGGYGYSGDVIGDAGSFIIKMDGSGNPIWEMHYNRDSVPIFRNGIFEGVAEAPEGNIFAFTSTQGIAKIDANGKRVWEKFIVSDSVFDIAATGDNGLLLATKTGISKIDSNGKLLWSEPSFNEIKRIIRLNNGGFAAISPDKIFKLDSSGKNIGAGKLDAKYSRYSAIAADNDAFYIVTDVQDAQGIDTGKAILSVNPSGFNVNWKINLFNNIEINDINVKENMLAITGTEFSARDSFISWGYAGNRVYRSFIKTFSTSGNTLNPGNDAGIIRVLASNNIIAKKVNTGIDTMIRYDLSVPVEVVIKNFGTSVLDSVSVMRLSWWGMNCSGESQYTFFKNLALKPGDTAKVSLGNLSFSFKSVDNLNSVELRFSVNTLSPNGMLDYNVNNDMLSSIIKRTVTSINEPQFRADIKVFPNPATDVLNIESEQVLSGTISLINTLGQELFSLKMNAESSVSVPLNNVPPGLYIVKISNGNSSIFRNIVVNR